VKINKKNPPTGGTQREGNLTPENQKERGMNDFSMTIKDVQEEMAYIENVEEPVRYQKKKYGFINERTFDLVKKIFTKKNKSETSCNYNTYFPNHKYYTTLKGTIDAIRIHIDCMGCERTEGFRWVRNPYVGSNGKEFSCICIYPSRKQGKALKGLSSIIPSGILIEISKKKGGL
jgi:hypothetical protein